MDADARFRALVESMLGTPYEGELTDVAQALGVKVDDPSTWAELEARWEALGPEIEAMRSVSDSSFDAVEPTFQTIIERDHRVFDPDHLRSYSEGIRMLIATRIIEGQVDNGGWPAVFYNSVDGHLAAAIDGYRLLGLDEHSSIVERVLAHGWTEPTDGNPDDDAWDTFDGAWIRLPDPEAARGRFIREHPEDFPE